MTRPVYETETHLNAEGRLAAFIKQKWACDIRKLSRKAQIDYAMYRKGKLVAFAELKCRTNPKNAYRTYMLSLDKITAALKLHDVTDLPVFLIVGWTDAVGYLKLSKPDAVDVGGRTDRNDAQDTELVGHYAIDTFVFFTNTENA